MRGWRQTRVTIQTYIINLFGVILCPAFKSLQSIFAKKTPNHVVKFIVFTSISLALCKEMSTNDALTFLFPQIVTLVINNNAKHFLLNRLF